MKMSAKTLQMRFFCSRELCRASTWCSAPIQICLFGVHNATIARKSTCHRKGENAELSKRYELIAFDLDGTLGEHKTPISDRHLELLRNLKERYQLVIAGAGTCQRIYNQVREFPIDILGSYGMQQSTVSLGQDGEYHLQMLRNDSVPVNIADTEERVFELRRKTGYLDYTGGNVEYHSSGAITFPYLGPRPILMTSWPLTLPEKSAELFTVWWLRRSLSITSLLAAPRPLILFQSPLISSMP